MIVIHSKSVKMLQDCYNKVKDRLEIACQVNDEGGVEARPCISFSKM